MAKALEIMNGIAKAMSGPRKAKVKQPAPAEPKATDSDQDSLDPVSETQSPDQENPKKLRGPTLKTPRLKVKLN